MAWRISVEMKDVPIGKSLGYLDRGLQGHGLLGHLLLEGSFVCLIEGKD